MLDTEKENQENTVVEPTTEKLDDTIKEKEELIKKQNELLEQQAKNIEIAKKVLEQQQSIQEKEIQNNKDPIEWFRKKLDDANYFEKKGNNVMQLRDRGKDPKTMDRLLSLYSEAYRRIHNLTPEEMFQRVADNVLSPMDTGKFRVDNIPE